MERALRLAIIDKRTGVLAGQAAFIALALIALFVLYKEPLWLFLVASSALALLVMVLDRRLVIPVIILAVPLEVSKDYLPSVYDDPATLTIQESILDAGRLAMLVAASLWVARARGKWLEDLPQSGLYMPLALLAGLFILSATYSENPDGAIRELLRLVSGIGIFCLVLLYVRDRRSLKFALIALLLSGLVLGLVGLYQQATDSYFFNGGLARLDIPRRNATFFDPNIYARFLVVVAAVGLGMAASAKSWRLCFILAAVGAALLALPFTSSRSNWAAAALVLPLVLVFLPIDFRRKTLLIAASAVAVLGMAAIVSVAEPTLVDRFQTIVEGRQSLGSRSYLMRAGWEMFVDHPVFGVGLDGYREALEGQYGYLLPPGATNFLSHSAVVTVMAELGLLGLGVLALLAYRFLVAGWHLWSGVSIGDKGLVVGIVGATIAIFASSQSEARLFEDPYLWLMVGLLVALSGIRVREAEGKLAEATPRL